MSFVEKTECQTLVVLPSHRSIGSQTDLQVSLHRAHCLKPGKFCLDERGLSKIHSKAAPGVRSQGYVCPLSRASSLDRCDNAMANVLLSAYLNWLFACASPIARPLFARLGATHQYPSLAGDSCTYVALRRNS